MKINTLTISIVLSFFLGVAIAGIGTVYFVDHVQKTINSNQTEKAHDPHANQSGSPALAEGRKRSYSILVAGKDLDAGNYFNDLIVRNRVMPGEHYTTYYILSRDYKDKIKGKRLNRKLRAGDPILIDYVE
ncbi:MAG: Flp pilus assembly protein CpaB [Gammaproteobacteria bacterium]